MISELKINIGKNTYITLDEIEQGIDYCMAEGLFLPGKICKKMGWHQDSLRNCLFHAGQHSIGKYVLKRRLSILTDMIEDDSTSLQEAANVVGMSVAAVTRFTRKHTGKSFMEQRSELQQRNANHSAANHSHWDNRPSCQ